MLNLLLEMFGKKSKPPETTWLGALLRYLKNNINIYSTIGLVAVTAGIGLKIYLKRRAAIVDIAVEFNNEARVENIDNTVNEAYGANTNNENQLPDHQAQHNAEHELDRDGDTGPEFPLLYPPDRVICRQRRTNYDNDSNDFLHNRRH